MRSRRRTTPPNDELSAFESIVELLNPIGISPSISKYLGKKGLDRDVPRIGTSGFDWTMMVGPKRFGSTKSTGYPLLSKKFATFFVGESQSEKMKIPTNEGARAEHALLYCKGETSSEGGGVQDPALQERLKTVYAQSKQWGIENRRLRESIARGDIVVVHEQRELCLADQGT